MTLYVVLTACKVPQEVSPIHMVELIVEEELHILSKSGLLGSRSTRPFAVGRDVIGLIAMHTGEEHLRTALIYVRLFLAGYYIAVALFGRCLYYLLVYIFALFYLGFAIDTFYFRHKCLTIQQRRFAILLAVEVTAECKNIFGRVLIHRCIGGRAYEYECIR